ncbi:hypothetical protein WOC76_06345 [Methylocystis sp. IM3]|uniref:hypothetical protein n=1 Tax=Methylocystis sp. IM3 TaxID=3136722 RepID=UPI00311A4519
MFVIAAAMANKNGGLPRAVMIKRNVNRAMWTTKEPRDITLHRSRDDAKRERKIEAS